MFYFTSLFLLSFAFGQRLGMQNDYCKIHRNHTLCLYSMNEASSSCGRITKMGLSSLKEQQMIVNLHNVKRALVANGKEKRGSPGPQPMASNMMELVWDDEMAALAQTWANRCPDDHDCPDCRRVRRFRTGQNLFVFGHFTGSWSRAVQGWYDEVADFDVAFIEPFYIPRGLLVGHYTQMLWAQVNRIGCGKLFSYPPRSRFGQQVFVCNYGLAGNLIGSQMYKRGEPCSACPSGTTCSSVWPGLCSGKPLRPLTVRPPVFADFSEFHNVNYTLGKSKSPDVVRLPDQRISAPESLELDQCTYVCKKSGGCSVAFINNNLQKSFSGSVMGSCFSPAFGSSCSGTPDACRECKQICSKDKLGMTLVFNIDQNVHGEEPVSQSPSNDPSTSSDSRINEDYCNYKCEIHGGCSVRIVSKRFVSGSVLGSCFSNAFGGKCSGTPANCQVCNEICENNQGKQLKRPTIN